MGTSSRTELIQRVEQLSRHYGKACNIPCQVIDLSDLKNINLVCPASNFKNSNSYCDGCIKSLIYNSQQAERFGGSYVFFCPGSLMYWVSPVAFDSKLDIVILAGPAVVVSIDDIEEDIKRIHPNPSTELVKKISKIRCVSPETVHSMSEILRMCASWASGYQEQNLLDKWQAVQVQSELFPVIERLKSEDETFPLYSFENESALQTAIMNKDMDGGYKALKELVGILFFHTHANSIFVVSRVQEIITLMSRAALCTGADDMAVWKICENSYKKLYLLQSFERILSLLKNIMRSFILLVVHTESDMFSSSIRKAMAYAHKNFSLPISIEEISKEVSISPSYFCRRFLTETGKTWTQYLNAIRVENSKKLLSDTNLSLLQIAEDVGFEDQSYFSRVFKKLAGMTARDYRKRSRKFPVMAEEIHT